MSPPNGPTRTLVSTQRLTVNRTRDKFSVHQCPKFCALPPASFSSLSQCRRINLTMATDNLTAILYKANDMRLEQLPVPEPKDDEVLLEMACVGICGSDVHYLTRGSIGKFVLNEPMIMGHEASGTVAKVGSSVKNLKVGDRVAIEPGVSCRKCSYCKEGRYNLCPDIVFCATPPVHGNLRRYYPHAADFCHKLPDWVSMEEGAMLEPLSVGVHACRRAGVSLGSNVLILGAGPIGLVTLLTAKAMGATRAIITDMVRHRLEVAKKCGADGVIQVAAEDSVKFIAEKVHDLLGAPPDQTIDCGGFQSTIELGIEVTKPGGVFVLVGMGSDRVDVPLVSATIKEVDVKGVFRYANDYPLALKMVASGKVDLKPLLTHNFDIEETHKAFETAMTPSENAIKVMIHCKKKSA